MLFRGDRFGDDQSATAAWARQREDAGRFISIAVAVIVGVFMLRRPGPEQAPDPGNIGRAVAVSEEAVVANTMLSLGQDMDEDPADELIHLEGHGGVPPGTGDAVILDAEGDAVVVHADQAAVGNRHSVRVARQVGQHRLRPGEGLLGIHDPLDLAQRLQEGIEGILVQQVGVIAVELELAGFVQLDQSFQNEAPVQTGQNPDGEEEVPAAVDPLGAVGRQAAARNNHVNMGMMHHRRARRVGDAPLARCVEHGCDADPGPEMLGVGCDPDHRVRARPHQQIVDLPLVLKRDVGDRFGQREDQVEIPHGQKFGLACRKPGLGRTRLTFGAMAIAA